MTPDEYDEQLADELLADGPLEHEWDAAQAERIMAAYRAVKLRRAELEELWQTRIDEMMRQRDELLDPLTVRCRELASYLETWGQHNRTDRTKSWALPSGKVSTRMVPPSVSVKADELPDEWVTIVEQRKPRTDELKAHVAATSEAVPGVTVKPGYISVTVTAAD